MSKNTKGHTHVNTLQTNNFQRDPPMQLRLLYSASCVRSISAYLHTHCIYTYTFCMHISTVRVHTKWTHVHLHTYVHVNTHMHQHTHTCILINPHKYIRMHAHILISTKTFVVNSHAQNMQHAHPFSFRMLSSPVWGNHHHQSPTSYTCTDMFRSWLT